MRDRLASGSRELFSAEGQTIGGRRARGGSCPTKSTAAGSGIATRCADGIGSAASVGSAVPRETKHAEAQHGVDPLEQHSEQSARERLRTLQPLVPGALRANAPKVVAYALTGPWKARANRITAKIARSFTQ